MYTILYKSNTDPTTTMRNRKHVRCIVVVVVLVFVFNLLLSKPYIAWVKIVNTTFIRHNMSDSGSQTTHLSNVPKIIYMLWDKGWANAPLLQRHSIRSFQRHNPDFLIKAMNLSEAEALISRKGHYSDVVWQRAGIQAKSDIIRVELLARYGGVWADASVYCNEPLLDWLNDTLLPANLFAFERRDAEVNKNNSPWIASWFLVATTDSDMIRIWRDRVRKAWTKTPLPPQKLGYYWVHRIFRNLVLLNSTFGSFYHAMPFVSADPSHCWGAKDIFPHVYKLKAASCSKVREVIFAKEQELQKNHTETK